MDFLARKEGFELYRLNKMRIIQRNYPLFILANPLFLALLNNCVSYSTIVLGVRIGVKIGVRTEACFQRFQLAADSDRIRADRLRRSTALPLFYAQHCAQHGRQTRRCHARLALCHSDASPCAIRTLHPRFVLPFCVQRIAHRTDYPCGESAISSFAACIISSSDSSLSAGLSSAAIGCDALP